MTRFVSVAAAAAVLLSTAAATAADMPRKAPMQPVAAADVAVKIPMVGGVDSLNVATAGAVAFYALGAGR